MKTVNEIVDIKDSPCVVCVVKSMCRSTCEEFIDHLQNYIRLDKLSSYERNEIITELFMENNKFFKGLE